MFNGKKIIHQKYDIVCLSVSSYVQESVRWLAERGEADKCIKILKNIAKTNRKEVKEDIYDSFKVGNFGNYTDQHALDWDCKSNFFRA